MSWLQKSSSPTSEGQPQLWETPPTSSSSPIRRCAKRWAPKQHGRDPLPDPGGLTPAKPTNPSVPLHPYPTKCYPLLLILNHFLLSSHNHISYFCLPRETLLYCYLPSSHIVAVCMETSVREDAEMYLAISVIQLYRSATVSTHKVTKFNKYLYCIFLV